MRKILAGIVVLALSFLLIMQRTESLSSSENTNEKPSEVKSPTQKPVEQKPVEPKQLDPKSAALKSDTPQTAEAARPRPAPIDPALEEILRIRAENGSLLQGSMLEKISRSAKAHVSDDSDPPPDLFAESLQKVAKETPTAPTSFVDLPPDSDDPPPLLGPSGESEPTPPNESAETTESIVVSIVVQLRGTSRMLDDRANDLEERRRYDDAKRLRKLSDQARAERGVWMLKRNSAE